MEPQNFAVEYQPTLSERVWRKLGFRHAYCPYPEPQEGLCESAITVNTLVVVSGIDRLRLLVSGKMSLQMRVQTDVPVERAYTSVDVKFLPPFGKNG